MSRRFKRIKALAWGGNDKPRRSKIYDPFRYWNRRSEPNTEADPGISRHDRDFIVRNIPAGSALLEFGPGVGRLLELYRPCQSVTTVDISRQYQDRLQARAARLRIRVDPHFLPKAFDDLPFPESQFDIAIASYVLIHVPFESIRHTMSELGRCSRRVLVISGIDDAWPRRVEEVAPSSHCFSHDYESIVRELGLSVQVKHESESALRFVYGRNT